MGRSDEDLDKSVTSFRNGKHDKHATTSQREIDLRTELQLQLGKEKDENL
jgi:hypothetical protein